MPHSFEHGRNEKINKDFELEQRLAPEKIALHPEDIKRKAQEIAASGALEYVNLRLPNVDIIGASLAKNPNRKEDAILVYDNPNLKLFAAAILDGVGSQKGGYEGSHFFKDEIVDALSKISVFEGDLTILEALQIAHKNYQNKLDALGEKYKDADSTLSLIFGFPYRGLMHVCVVSAGDSPVYVADKGGFRKILQQDVSLTETLRRSGTISDLAAKVHPHNHVIPSAARHPTSNLNDNSNLPKFPFQVDILELNDGDQLLMASDGFTAQFREDPTVDEVKDMRGMTPAEIIAASRLRAAQNIDGLSKDDDVSVIKVRITLDGGSNSHKEGEENNREANSDTLIENNENEEARNNRIFTELSKNRQLLSFLAETVLENLALRELVSSIHVGMFYEKFPKKEVFNAKFVLKDFLNKIEKHNGIAKRREYEHAAQQFIEIMYPSK